jgi:hypothetical protein
MTYYESGYKHGTLAAVKYIDSVRSRVARGAIVSPSELGYVLAALMKKLDALGGWAIAERPVAEHSPEQQAILGEYFGFCASLMRAL